MNKPYYDAKNKIWYGKKVGPLFNPDQNLGYLILTLLQQTPDQITQISADTKVSVTCKEMYDRTLKIMKFLSKSDIKETDIVGLLTSNTENLAPVVFACFVLGLPINPLSPIMNTADVVEMFSKIPPKLIFCDGENLNVVQEAVNEIKSNVKIITIMDKVDGYDCVIEILNDLEGIEVCDSEFPVIDPMSTALILCSSGSTGSSKGVCKSHKEIIHDLRPFFKQNLPKPVTAFQTSNIFWFSGIYFLITGTLFKCIRIITRNSIEPQLVVEIINKYQVNAIFLGPYVIAKMLQISDLKPMNSITDLVISGAPLTKELLESFKKFIPNGSVFNCYGCSEENYIAINDNPLKSESCGVPYYNFQIKIFDDYSNSLGPNEIGEILLKKPVQFNGYFNDSEKTKESFEGDWFKTGDMGYFDDDGYLYFVNRKKEMLKYENFQVTPSEIEAVINEIKGIINCSVVGVYNAKEGNDIIHAFVIADKSSNLTDKSILEYVNGKVIEPKKIRGGVHIVDSFPLTFSGKVSKIELRKIAAQMT